MKSSVIRVHLFVYNKLNVFVRDGSGCIALSAVAYAEQRAYIFARKLYPCKHLSVDDYYKHVAVAYARYLYGSIFGSVFEFVYYVCGKLRFLNAVILAVVVPFKQVGRGSRFVDLQFESNRTVESKR